MAALIAAAAGSASASVPMQLPPTPPFLPKTDRYFEGCWRKDDGFTVYIRKKDGHMELSIIGAGGDKEFGGFAPVYLDGLWGFVVNWADHKHPEWRTEEFRPLDPKTMQASSPFRRRLPPRSMFTHAQLKTFYERGFVVIPGAVAEHQVKQARRTIYSDIGVSGIPTERIPEFNARGFTPNLNLDHSLAQPLVETFTASTVQPLIKSLLGRPNPVWGLPQIAIRFPTHPAKDFAAPRLTGAHIDGIPTPTNGVVGNYLHSFTVLVGVALSDQTEEFQGNLAVYPGSHRRTAAYFRRQWDEQSAKGVPEKDRVLGPFADGAAWGSHVPPGATDGIEPEQVRMKRGDVVIAHYMLAHCIAQNLNDEPRINLYYRLNGEDHDLVRSLLNPWECIDSIHEGMF